MDGFFSDVATLEPALEAVLHIIQSFMYLNLEEFLDLTRHIEELLKGFEDLLSYLFLGFSSCYWGGLSLVFSTQEMKTTLCATYLCVFRWCRLSILGVVHHLTL